MCDLVTKLEYPPHRKFCIGLFAFLILTNMLSLIAMNKVALPNSKIADTTADTKIFGYCRMGLVESVRAILHTSKSSVHERDAQRNTPLHLAAEAGNPELVSLLLTHEADINARNANGETPLLAAVNKNSATVVGLLLEKGADHSAQNKQGRTALHTAADKGFDKVLISLLDAKANATVKDSIGQTPLHVAVNKNNIKIINLLISAQADINAKDTANKSALHMAAQRGYLEVVEKLIVAGAQTNDKDKQGKTALHHAALLGYKQIVTMLLMYGADASIKDTTNNTAHDLAWQNGHTEMLTELKSRKYSDKTLNTIGVLSEEHKIFQALVRLLRENNSLVRVQNVNRILSQTYSNAIAEIIKERTDKLKIEDFQLLGVAAPLKDTQLCMNQNKDDVSHTFDSNTFARFGEKYARGFNGLALDGEGLETVITASMVKTLAEELKCPMHKLFDCIVGTSFGGIVALGLAASKEGGCPLLGTDDLMKFFAKYNNNIKKLKIKNDWDTLKQGLNTLFKGSRLSDALTRVIVPCKKKHEPFVFDSREAQKREIANSYIRNIAWATCTETENEVTASIEYKNKAAELLFKKMEASLDDNEREKIHILYCANNAEDEGRISAHKNLSEKLNSSAVRYCRIKPENNKIGSFDNKELVTVYKETGEAAAENFLKGNESFIRMLQENRAGKDKASY